MEGVVAARSWHYDTDTKAIAEQGQWQEMSFRSFIRLSARANKHHRGGGAAQNVGKKFGPR